jgi:DNA polymerase-1
MNKYLILDCNYLCHRAKHTTGSLKYGDNATGIIYGFLKNLSGFQDMFQTSKFIFCWDSASSIRREIYPDYKGNRPKDEDRTEEEIEFEKAFRKQVKKLRTTYLPLIGFKNIFIQKGYESDDIMASICKDISTILMNMEAVIITSDKDLYQCISPNVSVYNPQKNRIITLQRFKKEYGIVPKQWGLMKAIAGCTTDNVKGVAGVGEKTAIKYLLGTLKECKRYFDITCPMGDDIIHRNIKLVELPMVGTREFQLKDDELSEDGWKQVMKMLGMKSLRNKMPFTTRRKLI